MTQVEARNLMNQWGKESAPFIFIIDFNMEKFHCYRMNEIPHDLIFEINGFSNQRKSRPTSVLDHNLQLTELPFEVYNEAFDEVLTEIKRGNSYLLNLTFETPIDLNVGLNELFPYISAKYKLKFSNDFVVFSPETFVKINGNEISSFPMKGTIDASIENAKQILLEDKKEEAEHATIVDLLRNDLSKVARKVTLDKYRYLDKIETPQKSIFQTSSKITGELLPQFQTKFGDILCALLPAGSISGAPKKKTLEIIHKTENYKRGYYTGVFGYFDGKNLDSAVMIRFIENKNGKLFYKSGGGITHLSNAKMEYKELIDKIYVPVYRDLKNL